MALDNKSRGDEQIHANKNENDFRVIARRNKLLGLWLAEIFGISDAESYAIEVVLADLEEPGDEDIIRKVMKDIADHDAGISEDEVREKLKTLMTEAKTEA